MDKTSIPIYLKDPKDSVRRIKILHILGAVVMLLMGTAFAFYPEAILKLIGILSGLSGLMILYFCLPSQSYRLLQSNTSLRTIEVVVFLLLSIGFLVLKRYLNFGFMLAMTAAYGAMLYVEQRTSTKRYITFSDEGLEFSSLQKHFFFSPEEISKVQFDDRRVHIKFSDGKFLDFILADKVPNETATEIEQRYSQN